MRRAPFAGGFFTGDYEGLASAGNDFGAFFGQTHGTDPGSIFFRRVGAVGDMGLACPALGAPDRLAATPAPLPISP